jgi:hypothetical protein
MLKKILILFVLLIISSGCSKISIKEEIEVENSRFYQYYSRWELDELKEEIEDYKKNYGNTQEVIKYGLLLTERLEAKEKLEKLISTVKEEISKNDLTTLEKHMSKSLRNAATIKDIKKLDFTKYRLFISKTKFEDDIANNIIALNIGEETFYFDVEFKYEKRMWEVMKFRERR